MKTNFKFNTAFILFITAASLFGQPGFKVSNLDSIPAYEYYEFEGEGSSMGEIPMAMEYKHHRKGKSDAWWEVNGSMELKNTLIEEDYKIMFKNLLIISYKRKQTFERGTLKTDSELDIDVVSEDPDEFIVGTIPGLTYILRTYPFESGKKEFRVRAPQQTKGHLNLKVKNRGKEKMKTKHFGEIQVWHLEVSLMIPVIGALLPKLNYYFRDDPHKTLVAMKGFMPATGKDLDVELKKYRSEQ